MFSVYLFATLVGWPFVLFFLFFSADADADADFDADLEADFDVDADVDSDLVTAVGSGVADAVLSIFSFRALVFLFAFFGVTGLILRGLGLHAVLTFILAVGMGLFAGYLHARLYAYLKRSSVGGMTTDSDLRGSQARIVVPISDEQKGRIEVDVDGQPVYVTAKAFGGGSYEKGERVVVVEIENGTALVGQLNLDE
jgi:membrane protein implicated in regulation of membrane protease activity